MWVIESPVGRLQLILGWEETFATPIDEAAARAMRTTDDAVDYLYARLKDNLSGAMAMYLVETFEAHKPSP